jgi:hypothetical protein
MYYYIISNYVLPLTRTHKSTDDYDERYLSILQVVALVKVALLHVLIVETY